MNCPFHLPALERVGWGIQPARLWDGAVLRGAYQAPPCSSSFPDLAHVLSQGSPHCSQLCWLLWDTAGLQWVGLLWLSFPHYHPWVALGCPWSPCQLPQKSLVSDLQCAPSAFAGGSILAFFNPVFLILHLPMIPQNFSSTETYLLLSALLWVLQNTMHPVTLRFASRTWILKCWHIDTVSTLHCCFAYTVPSIWNALPHPLNLPTAFILQNSSQEKLSRKPYPVSPGRFNLSTLLFWYNIQISFFFFLHFLYLIPFYFNTFICIYVWFTFPTRMCVYRVKI